MKLNPSETLLVGNWVAQDGRVVADQVSQRIDNLVTKCLIEIGRDSSGWDVLYRDPEDGRLWELTYPHSDLQGGGPPQLRCLESDEATLKYGKR